MDNNIFKLTFQYFSPTPGGEQQRKNNLMNGEKNMNTILKKYKEYLEVQYRKPNTITRYLDAAKKLFDYTTILDQEHINQYLIYLNKNHKPNTVSNNIQGMNKLLTYLERPDLKHPIPAWKPIYRDTITTEEILRLQEYIHENCDILVRLFFLFIRDMDCRPHEIIKARWDWIHGNKILFQDCKTGDTTGILSQETQDLLEEWRKQGPRARPGHTQYIFVNIRGRYQGMRLSEKGYMIRETIKKITKQVIGRSLTPQDLRASIITEEYNNYVNPKIIQQKARHRREITTMRYNHVTEKMQIDYMTTGNIFSRNKNTILQPTMDDTEDKATHIKPFAPQEITLKPEDETNTIVSFSFYFFSGFLSCNAFSLKKKVGDINGGHSRVFFMRHVFLQPPNNKISSQTAMSPYNIIRTYQVNGKDGMNFEQNNLLPEMS